jgi:hypothetical protein
MTTDYRGLCAELAAIVAEEYGHANATNQSVAAIDFPSQEHIDGNSIALVCYRGHCP